MIFKLACSSSRGMVFPLVTFAILSLSGCGGGDTVADNSYRHAHALTTAGSNTAPLTPAQIKQLYSIPTGISGTSTIIVVAYHYSQLQNDTNKFFQKYNLQPPVLSIVNQAGSVQNANWALESTIDVAMVAIANEFTNITVIEAKSDSAADMMTAVKTAQNMNSNAVISMSWGGSEFSSQGSQNNLFSKSNNTWVAATGDSGVQNFPATNPGVIAVGGTSVTLTPSSYRLSETPWISGNGSGSGCGISSVELKPTYQNISAVTAANGTAYRSVPDVAFVGDPNTGVSIYNSLNGGWLSVGGTSVSTPLFAGIVSLANASRKKNNLRPFTSNLGVTGTAAVALQPYLYDLLSSNGGPNNSTVLYDVGSGFTCAGTNSKPTTGYTLVSGLGTVNVQALINYLNTKP